MSNVQNNAIGLGLVFGVAFGVVLGSMIFDDLPIGIAVGSGVGLAFGGAFSLVFGGARSQSKKGQQATEAPSDDVDSAN